MNIIKYDPFRELRGLHDEMSRLFSGVGPSMQGDEFARGAWSPNVDIFEDSDKLIVEAELPDQRHEQRHGEHHDARLVDEELGEAELEDRGERHRELRGARDHPPGFSLREIGSDLKKDGDGKPPQLSANGII